jgi:hypothetical protein
VETDRADVSSLYSAACVVQGRLGNPAFGCLVGLLCDTVVHLQVECAEEHTAAVGYAL